LRTLTELAAKSVLKYPRKSSPSRALGTGCLTATLRPFVLSAA
jgi:hypothetical protein